MYLRKKNVSSAAACGGPFRFMCVRSFASILLPLLVKKDLRSNLTLHVKELKREEKLSPKFAEGRK